MTIRGIHHITLVSGDIRRTAAFYTRALGLRLVKRTVNFDDPGSYHLYFGDEIGRPATLVTFFDWPQLPPGQWGIGGRRGPVEHTAKLLSVHVGKWYFRSPNRDPRQFAGHEELAVPLRDLRHRFRRRR